MNKELTDALLRDFPILYGLKTVEYLGQKDVPTTFSLYKFECGDGWEPLIRGLSEELEHQNLGATNPIQARQVKEKFGGLRFYTNPVDEYINEVIQEAEAESLKTCEDCGSIDPTITTSSGKDHGWIRTLCPKCREAWEIKRGAS